MITENLLPLLLLLYVRFNVGLDCWPSLSMDALRNWTPMIELSIHGLVMVLAEYFAFEILTLSASWISPIHLAANSVLQTLTVLMFQGQFALSIAASTRVGNLVGAQQADVARTAIRVAITWAAVLGFINMLVLTAFRNQIPWLFTRDAEVASLVAQVLLINAASQLFDALATTCNGLLRGLGKQHIGGWANLFSYYVVSIFRLCNQLSCALTNLNTLLTIAHADCATYFLRSVFQSRVESLRVVGWYYDRPGCPYSYREYLHFKYLS